MSASHPSSPAAITDLLLAWNDGEAEALDRLIPLVETELHRLAHRHMAGEAAGHPLQTTALVNEAYVRLIDGSRIRWQNRAHFFAVSARLMRRILVDVARARHRQKRGADAVWISLTDAPDVPDAPAAEVIALDDALTALAAFDARKSRVVELRFFGGLTVEETAEALQVSAITVMRDWSLARAWLTREILADRSSTAQPSALAAPTKVGASSTLADRSSTAQPSALAAPTKVGASSTRGTHDA